MQTRSNIRLRIHGDLTPEINPPLNVVMGVFWEITENGNST